MRRLSEELQVLRVLEPEDESRAVNALHRAVSLIEHRALVDAWKDLRPANWHSESDEVGDVLGSRIISALESAAGATVEAWTNDLAATRVQMLSDIARKLLTAGRASESDERGRRALQMLRDTDQRSHSSAAIAIFISHAADDSDLAALLVNLIERSLNLAASRIRCSALEGYRLPDRSSVHDTMLARIYEADTFIAIIPGQIGECMNVAFELGARWGSGRPCLPIVAHEAPKFRTKYWFESAYNAFSVDTESEVERFLLELSAQLRLKRSAAQAYESQLLALLERVSSDDGSGASGEG